MPVNELVTPEGQDCWTPPRLELRAWLRRNAPSLAELYEGAVQMMFIYPVPGRIRFVSQAVREIGNRLPEVISGVRSGGRLEYANELDTLSELWMRAGLATDGSLPSSVAIDDSTTPAAPDVPIDPTLFVRIATLISKHRATREKPESTAIRLFESVAPENMQFRDTLRPVVRQWLQITGWFQKRTHVPLKPEHDYDADEFQQKFELFETTLAALVRAFFSTVEELDEILEDTNS